MRSPGAGGPWHQLTQLVVDEPLIPRDVTEANENVVQEASAGYLVTRGLALETARKNEQTAHKGVNTIFFGLRGVMQREPPRGKNLWGPYAAAEYGGKPIGDGGKWPARGARDSFSLFERGTF